MNNRKPTIALIDDHFIVRKGLRNLIESFNEFAIAFDVDNFIDLQNQLKENRHLDILLMDIKMPVKDGFEIALWMRDHYPLIKVLAVSSEEDGFSIAKIIRNGAKGFCGKSASPTELLIALQTVNKGDVYLSQKSLNLFNEVLQNSTNYFTQNDLTFSESNSVQWENNTFLGRPEEIYTYKSTSRGGTLSFKVVVDHPSVMNLLVNKVLNNTASSQIADQVIDSFFAGLTKFDIFELSKRYNNFSTTELSQIQKVINGSSNPEKIKDIVTQSLNIGGDAARSEEHTSELQSH